MTRLPLDELTNHLAKVQSDVEKWAQQTSSGAAEKREQHLQDLQNPEGDMQCCFDLHSDRLDVNH